jgi:hypothetical protein
MVAGVGVSVLLLVSGTVMLPSGAALASTQTGGRSSEGSVTITQADSGRSYSLGTGDRLKVKLSGSRGQRWLLPAASNPKVLVRRSGTVGTITTATFLAATRGRTSVTAVLVLPCTPGCTASPLVVPVRFHVTVVVT